MQLATDLQMPVAFPLSEQHISKPLQIRLFEQEVWAEAGLAEKKIKARAKKRTITTDESL